MASLLFDYTPSKSYKSNNICSIMNLFNLKNYQLLIKVIKLV
jgi:hypothetical protein